MIVSIYLAVSIYRNEFGENYAKIVNISLLGHWHHAPMQPITGKIRYMQTYSILIVYCRGH